ncbi:MAG: DUF4143 domain-containing protein [Kiritimatiellae bacterium]|nr:DUF4143 domain-containing protein [Kiritimatiellia bacterium]
MFPKAEHIVFDSVVDVGNAKEDPELFLRNRGTPLILDEIQYVPELVPSIKRQVDQHKEKGLYILTGSQQWSVMKTASESLAGRASFVDLEGFCLSEIFEQPTENHWLKRYLEDPASFVQTKQKRLDSKAGLFEQLWRGFLPDANSFELEWIPEYFQGYLRTYIERDVRLLGEVADWGQFSRFVRISSALSAQEVNHSQLGREIGITPQTAQRWLSMLRATYQWFEIPAFHGNTLKRISSKPKGYFGDTGMASHLQMISSPDVLSGHPLAGSFFETAVVSEIRKLSKTLPVPPALYHWRSHGGAEVDLLMERDGTWYPIEVKMHTRPGKKDAKGIHAFRESYPALTVSPGLVICPCEQIQPLSNHAHAVPWDLI